MFRGTPIDCNGREVGTGLPNTRGDSFLVAADWALTWPWRAALVIAALYTVVAVEEERGNLWWAAPAWGVMAIPFVAELTW